MTHPDNDQILENIADEILRMDRAEKVHFCKDYYPLDTVNNMSEDELDEKIHVVIGGRGRIDIEYSLEHVVELDTLAKMSMASYQRN